MVDTVPDASNYFKNPDFQKQMDAINKSTEVIKKYFESDVWKNQQKLIQKSTAELNNYFKSSTMEKSIRYNSKKYRSDWSVFQQ